MPRRRLILVTAILTSAASPAAEPMPRVIDDTPEYCRSLAGRWAALPAARLEPSRTLGEQGVRLCGEGHTRTGITKLRRALRAAMGPRAAEASSAAAGGAAEARAVTR